MSESGRGAESGRQEAGGERADSTDQYGYSGERAQVRETTPKAFLYFLHLKLSINALGFC